MATNGLKILLLAVIGSCLLFTETVIYLKILGILIICALSLYASHTDTLIEKLRESSSIKSANNLEDKEWKR